MAFGTLYAEAQRRYLESVSPYARRLFHQTAVPEVDSIDGLPPAVALQQQRGASTTRSSVGSVTTLSNLLRMLYSRAGTYPRGQDHLEAEPLFVVEHEIDVIRHADWIVDVGPAAGEQGGRILCSGPPAGLASIAGSQTARHLFAGAGAGAPRTPRAPRDWLRLRKITRHNLRGLDVDFPLGVFTTVTGVSGSGKSSLVSQVLVELVARHLGQPAQSARDGAKGASDGGNDGAWLLDAAETTAIDGRVTSGLDRIGRLVPVDQRAIGRTPRSNLATYTGLFERR